ncbi:MAG: hypothetical protein GY820_19945, partial [Gammaproteobacteria bacterium]|nr:hypothetical protein [Gammaproteobacteria bacterium]
MKNFVGQFVDTGVHSNPQGSGGTQVHSSIPNQSQGALGMGPSYSGANSDGDQERNRGRLKDRDASQNGQHCQSGDARQNAKGRVVWHKHHQPQPQSISKQPQYSNSQNQTQNSQNPQNSNFQNHNQNSFQQNNSNFQNRNNQTERGGQQMFSTPNHQRVANPNPNPNQVGVIQEQVSPMQRGVYFEEEYEGDEEGESEGGRGHQGHPNQNPPTPMGYGNGNEDGYEGYDERYDSDNAQGGQMNAYQGQRNNNRQNQGYQNNHGQNHNR